LSRTRYPGFTQQRPQEWGSSVLPQVIRKSSES